MSKAKSFAISKRVVWESYKEVRANKGSAGVDSETLKGFEGNLAKNLYKIWNRMSSGSYFPPPVRRVWIPKPGGGKRPLGIPTVGDRIAQGVVKRYLEPLVEPEFHSDSYGYRPGKSAHQAVGAARKRCWEHDWVIDLDIRGFFDELDHDLLRRAVRRYTSCRWILLYIDRWLKAPVELEDGTLESRDRGIPQGGVASPLLANIFLHLAFDLWMRKEHPDVPFERYADDVIVHCKTKAHARSILCAIEQRFGKCKLELHPEKTKIVYCKDDNRPGRSTHESFDFLGFTFQPRRARNRWGRNFITFTPAVSTRAATSIRQKMRGWRLPLWTSSTLDDVARQLNPVIRGWIGYYSKYCKSALRPVLEHLNRLLAQWVMRKFKRYRRHLGRAIHWLGRVAQRDPKLFAHWGLLGVRPAAG